MSGEFDGMDPVPIHLESVGAAAAATIAAAPSSSARTRKALRTNTFTLTAAQPYMRVLPESDERLEAWLTSATEASPPVLYMAPNQADAAAAGGGAAQIIGSETAPVPVNCTDPVWVYAATGYPVTVSVWATYQVRE